MGIIGYGFVGKAVEQLGTLGQVEIYDKYIQKYSDNWLKVINQDFVFVCVPTNLKDSKLDTSIIDEVALLWGKRTNMESILIIKSTVPVGTVDRLQRLLKTDRIVFNPEFLTERTANVDFIEADEIIVGASSVEIGRKIAALYTKQLKNFTAKYTTPKIAELIKLARNSLYAVKIEFMNEIHDLCDSLDIKYDEFRTSFVWEGNNAWVCDQHTFVPGPDGKKGFGGKCLPKDISGLRAVFKEGDIESPVIDSTILANPSRRK